MKGTAFFNTIVADSCVLFPVLSSGVGIADIGHSAYFYNTVLQIGRQERALPERV